jgi:hypothetical protein
VLVGLYACVCLYMFMLDTLAGQFYLKPTWPGHYPIWRRPDAADRVRRVFATHKSGPRHKRVPDFTDRQDVERQALEERGVRRLEIFDRILFDVLREQIDPRAKGGTIRNSESDETAVLRICQPMWRFRF